jgi:hypothetical protein
MSVYLKNYIVLRDSVLAVSNFWVIQRLSVYYKQGIAYTEGPKCHAAQIWLSCLL